MKKIVIALLAVFMFFAFTGCTPKQPDDPQTSDYIPVDRIECDIAEATLYVGEQVQLNAKVVPDSATKNGLQFSSLDTSVAMVNEKGLVVAVKEGQTDIMITAEDNDAKNLPIHIMVKAKETDPTPTPEPQPQPEPEPEPDGRKVLFSYTNIRDGVNKEYYPVITFYDNGEFEFYENIYEGMVTYLGTYSIEYGQDIIAYPDYIRFGQNVSPADLDKLRFYRISDKYMIMYSNAYLSEFEDIFVNGTDEKELAYIYYFPQGGVEKDYQSRIEMFTDRSFVLYINFYEGIDEVHGVFYTDDGVLYTFTPIDMYNNSGFDYKQFRLEETQAGFKLLTDLQGYNAGELITEWENYLH